MYSFLVFMFKLINSKTITHSTSQRKEGNAINMLMTYSTPF